MKAVVVEVTKFHVAVLQEDGSITRLKNSHLQIGDIVTMNTHVNKKRISFKHLAAVAAVLTIVLGAGMFAYAMPVYYISVDINPSILMRANIFERVLSTEAINEDALPILDKLNLKNTSVEKAVTKVMEQLNAKGYFDKDDTDEDQPILVIAASSKDEKRAEKLARKIDEAADEEIKLEGTDVDVDARGTGYDMVQKANELGITPGKLNIITHVLGIDSPDDYEDIAEDVRLGNLSVKDLMSVYKQTKDKNPNSNANNNKKSTTTSTVNEDIDDEEDDDDNDEDTDNKSNGNAASNRNNNGKALGTTKEKADDETTPLEETTENSNSRDKSKDDDEDVDDEDVDVDDENNEDDESDSEDQNDIDEDSPLTSEEKQTREALKDKRKELLNQIKGRKNN